MMKCAGCFEDVPYDLAFVVVVPWMPIPKHGEYASRGCYAASLPDIGGASSAAGAGCPYTLTFLCDGCFENEMRSQAGDRKRAAAWARSRIVR